MPRFLAPILPPLAAALAALGLVACGGSDEPATTAAGGSGASGGAGTLALTCNTSGYIAGSVEVPTAAQLAAYAASYDGDEGRYGPNPGDPFAKSGTATAVLAANGGVTYKGVAYSPTSVCIEKNAGTLGKLLYVVAGRGKLDIADKADATLGNAWGVSLADGTTIFTKGVKK